LRLKLRFMRRLIQGLARSQLFQRLRPGPPYKFLAAKRLMAKPSMRLKGNWPVV
jgi:hypothetical protein